MANPEHVRILNSGVEAWNSWRKRHPEVKPDLSGEDLRGCRSIPWFEIGVTHCWDELPDFTQANLTGAHLEKADLNGASFRKAILKGAHMRESKLLHSILAGADLEETDLYRADLSESNLEKANLNGAMLEDAGLTYVNLSGASLIKTIFRNANLIRASLVDADLTEADFRQARIWDADFSQAVMAKVNLSRAHIRGTRFTQASLKGAVMDNAWLKSVDLTSTDLREAALVAASLNNVDLADADLREAALVTTGLVKANLTRANLSGCRVYGVSAWDLTTDEAIQKDLIITDFHQPDISVDNIEVAQFIHLLLENQKIRQVIDTITTKVVLILGRFGNRKALLDGLRVELRKRAWVPVVFDFEAPQTRNFMETVSTVAHLSRFVLADITDATSVREELRVIVPNLFSVPVQPLLESCSSVYYNLSDYRHCPSVLETILYGSYEELIGKLPDIIDVVEAKALELTAPSKETQQV